eukprot:1189146-Prorocentrum_minimum.AAC.1
MRMVDPVVLYEKLPLHVLEDMTLEARVYSHDGPIKHRVAASACGTRTTTPPFRYMLDDAIANTFDSIPHLLHSNDLNARLGIGVFLYSD